jgi:ankyrin repeat protein
MLLALKAGVREDQSAGWPIKYSRKSRYHVVTMGISRQLHAAAWRGDTSETRRLLHAGADVNTMPRWRQWSPLMFAAASPRASIDLLQLLLEGGADPNLVSDRYEQYASVVAAAGLTCPIFRDEETALLIAARTGHLDIVQSLLRAGADVQFKDSNGCTVLLHAKPEPALIQCLLDAGAELTSVTNYGESALSSASKAGDFGVVRQLLEAGSDSGPLCWSPLMRAAAINSADDVAREIRRSVGLHERDPEQRTPWLISLLAGSHAKARLLLEAGANLDDRGRLGSTNLMLAAIRGDAEFITWLMDAGAAVNETDDFGTTALMEAARVGNAACAEALIRAGADACAESEFKDQAIHRANNSEVASLLVAAGADVNSVNGEGGFPLKSAADAGDTALVRGLLRLGADVETTRTGEIALHSAASQDHIEVMRLLLDAGSDPNAQDVDGDPPLDKAWSIPAFELLLSAGADLGLANGWAAELSPYHDDPDIHAYIAVHRTRR